MNKTNSHSAYILVQVYSDMFRYELLQGILTETYMTGWFYMACGTVTSQLSLGNQQKVSKIV